jgi:hypothetical protein
VRRAGPTVAFNLISDCGATTKTAAKELHIEVDTDSDIDNDMGFTLDIDIDCTFDFGFDIDLDIDTEIVIDIGYIFDINVGSPNSLGDNTGFFSEGTPGPRCRHRKPSDCYGRSSPRRSLHSI